MWKKYKAKGEKNPSLFFGIELEGGFNHDDELYDAIEEIDDLFNNHSILIDIGEDSTVERDYSIELRFYPGTYLWWLENKELIDNTLRCLRQNDCVSNTKIECGMHIHFSNVLSQVHLYRLYHLVFGSYMQMLAFSKRRRVCLDEYATFDFAPWSGGYHKIRKRKDTQLDEFSKLSPYRAALCRRLRTHEFRLCAGTLDSGQFWANLLFLVSLIHYTKHCTIEKSDWEHYLDWLYLPDQHDEYTSLIPYVQKAESLVTG